MDGPKIDYREKYERLATCKGEIVALFSDTLGRTHILGERFLLKAYRTAATHNALMPDDMKALSAHKMAVSQEGRAAIQAYKIKNGIPLDTPPVNQPVNLAANDENYGADIFRPEF